MLLLEVLLLQSQQDSVQPRALRNLACLKLCIKINPSLSEKSGCSIPNIESIQYVAPFIISSAFHATSIEIGLIQLAVLSLCSPDKYCRRLLVENTYRNNLKVSCNF